ncbi:hypothetical protein H0H93_004926 [Arthromyces matolae]|nr:hypothetical protein H0H93_004926 [Arthromyces matolae]
MVLNTDYILIPTKEISAAKKVLEEDAKPLLLMETSTSSASDQIRKKRVLPSRARRGGPSVGNCDTDIMILDTHRRRNENEPLIPSDTPFFLTTNSALASTSSSDHRVNIHAQERYFERPEVLKAYREQLTIETPEFHSIGDAPSGRLRARSQAGNADEGPLETSDAVYEKRHRKYETFEKRIRLREKEKLKHEHYKLKERIDQLRSTDALAFLALPDDLFPASSRSTDAESYDEEEAAIFGSQINGGASYLEGERRRREMLKVAQTIEERYRILLPPDRTKKLIGQPNAEPTVETELQSIAKQTVPSPDLSPVVETIPPKESKLKIKMSARVSNAANKSTATTPPLRKKQSHAKQRSHSKPQTMLEQPLANISTPEVMHGFPLTPIEQPTPNLVFPQVPRTPSSRRSPSPPVTSLSNPEIAVLEQWSPQTEAIEHTYTSTRISTSPDFHSVDASAPPVSTTRPYKRVKLSPTPTSPRQSIRETSVPPIAAISVPMKRHRSLSHASTVQSSRRYGSYAGGAEFERPGLLMKYAKRHAESKTSKGQRHTSAFGDQVKKGLFNQEKDFELPQWVWDTHPRSTRSNSNLLKG